MWNSTNRASESSRWWNAIFNLSRSKTFYHVHTCSEVWTWPHSCNYYITGFDGSDNSMTFCYRQCWFWALLCGLVQMDSPFTLGPFKRARSSSSWSLLFVCWEQDDEDKSFETRAAETLRHGLNFSVHKWWGLIVNPKPWALVNNDKYMLEHTCNAFNNMRREFIVSSLNFQHF